MAREKPIKQEPTPDPGVVLVPMEKDGEHILVHPNCVADHKQLGWRET